MGRSLKELRQAVAPLAPRVAAPVPAVQPTDRSQPLQEKIEERRLELKSGYPVNR